MLVQLETMVYLSDRLQKIQIKKMIGRGRYGQRDEDKLGVPGAHTHTHSKEACVDKGVHCCGAWC